VDLATRNEIGRLLMLPPDKFVQALEQHVANTKQPEAPTAWQKIKNNPKALEGVRRAMIAIAGQSGQPNASSIVDTLGLDSNGN
jgi:hypothetical protein